MYVPNKYLYMFYQMHPFLILIIIICFITTQLCHLFGVSKEEDKLSQNMSLKPKKNPSNLVCYGSIPSIMIIYLVQI